MPTAEIAQQSARQYIQTNLAGTIDRIEFVGMTSTSKGYRLGYKATWDKGNSVTDAVLDGLLFGLLAILGSAGVGLILRTVGVTPELLKIIGSLFILACTVYGFGTGANVSETENLTLTVNNGNVILINRNLSSGEFSRAIDRQYDRQTSQLDEAVSEVSKHWLIHKVVDRVFNAKKK